jgi:RNA polymerase sigma factor (sigma-70 family)
MLCDQPHPYLEEVDDKGEIGLLRRAEYGDKRAADDLIKICQPFLLQFFRGWSGFGTRASGGRDDLCQDVSIAVWQGVVARDYAAVLVAGDFWSIVRRRAKEIALSQRRFDDRQKRGGTLRIYTQSPRDCSATTRTADTPGFEVDEEIIHLVHGLKTTRQRSVAHLLFANYSPEEISRSLSLSMSTVKRRVKEIRDNLRPSSIEFSGSPQRCHSLPDSRLPPVI